jgi:hypothetical protein
LTRRRSFYQSKLCAIHFRLSLDESSNMRVLTVANAIELTSFYDVVQHDVSNTEDLHGKRISEVFRNIRLRFHGAATMHEKPEQESRIIAFIRVFIWPSLDTFVELVERRNFPDTFGLNLCPTNHLRTNAEKVGNYNAP